jgi:hypothetical protein
MTPEQKIKDLMARCKKIKNLENQIAKSDYKIIKCYEYSLVGLELPYDIEELHAQREELREEIRSLEKNV